jgi:ribosomal protein S1
VLEEEREEKKKHTLEVLAEGMVLTGTVKNITDYGAFIDLGGIDGLLHVTDMSWGRVGHPSEIFQVGDQVEVVVLHFDRESGRVSLGYKQKSSVPWERVELTYPSGTKVTGRVVSLTNYGAFIELEPGVEGLVHVRDVVDGGSVTSKIVNVGDEVGVIVLDVNRSAKRISLGMKQVEPDPWGTIDERYRIGNRVVGKVRNLTDFGAFIELEPGVDGLLHISDMSWTRNVGHPSEVLKKGQEIETQILNIDKENKRISLGLKQVQPDPWTTVAQRFPMGSRVTGKVVRLTDFGAFVELEPGVDGLLHISQMSSRPIATPARSSTSATSWAAGHPRRPQRAPHRTQLEGAGSRHRRTRAGRGATGGRRRPAQEGHAALGLRLRRRGIDVPAADGRRRRRARVPGGRGAVRDRGGGRRAARREGWSAAVRPPRRDRGGRGRHHRCGRRRPGAQGAPREPLRSRRGHAHQQPGRRRRSYPGSARRDLADCAGPASPRWPRWARSRPPAATTSPWPPIRSTPTPARSPAPSA